MSSRGFLLFDLAKESASVGALFGRSYRLSLLIQCVEEGLSILQFVCKPHPCLGKIGEMLS